MSDEYEDFGVSKNFNWTDDYLNNLDTSQYPFPNVLWHLKPAEEIALKTTAMLFVALIGIFLNLIILLTLLKNKWLWTASNYLIGNLALVDLLTLILCPWFMLVRDFHQNFVLKEFGCYFESFLQSFFMLANVAAVMLVSYDRVAAAALTTEARITRSAAPKFIFASWVLVALISLPWITYRQYTERYWLDYIEMYCVEDVNVMGVYWHFILMLVVWLPLGILAVTYTTIMWRLECSARKLYSRGGGLSIIKARGKAMRTSACVLLATIICRVPYTVLMYWRNNTEKTINWVDGSYAVMWFSANFLIFLNAAINPLIYGFTNTRFKRAMNKTHIVSWFKFGSWCCVCNLTKTNKEIPEENKTDQKIFVIDATPGPNKKILYVIKNILHINKETVEFSDIKVDEVTTRPTKVTPIKHEDL